MHLKYSEVIGNSFVFLHLGSLSMISKEVLHAVTNDNKSVSNRTIYFTVITPPKFGKLVNVQADKSTTDISSFTQRMVSFVSRSTNRHSSVQCITLWVYFYYDLNPRDFNAFNDTVCPNIAKDYKSWLVKKSVFLKG